MCIRDRLYTAQHWKSSLTIEPKYSSSSLPFFPPSFRRLCRPPPPHSFIFWLSFHFSRGQNRKSFFLCSETKRKRLLRRLTKPKLSALSSADVSGSSRDAREVNFDKIRSRQASALWKEAAFYASSLLCIIYTGFFLLRLCALVGRILPRLVLPVLFTKFFAVPSRIGWKGVTKT